MKKDQLIRVTLDLPNWIVAALMSLKGPPEIIGETLEERAYFVLDDHALHIESAAHARQERDKSRDLHKRVGLPVVDDDDGIDL